LTQYKKGGYVDYDNEKDEFLFGGFANQKAKSGS
jgi:hypothetical protein